MIYQLPAQRGAYTLHPGKRKVMYIGGTWDSEVNKNAIWARLTYT